MDKQTLVKAIFCALIMGYPNEYKVNNLYIPLYDYEALGKQAIELADTLIKQLNNEPNEEEQQA